MANVSPGVYSKIIDLSEYAQQIPSTIGFVPIISERGQDNTLIFTNSRDFYLDFGTPNINYATKAYGQGPYICDAFLRESDALYVIRCLPDTAAFSNLAITTEATDALGADSTADITASSIASLSTTTEVDTQIADDSNVCVVFYGVGRGEWYNNFKIKISEHANPLQLGVYVLDIYQKQAAVDEDGNAQYEIVNTFEVSFDYTKLDAAGNSMFIEDVVNNYSRYIKCVANKTTCLAAITNGADFSQPFVGGEVALQNGSSGDLFGADGRIDATVATQILSLAYQGSLNKQNGSDLLFEVKDTESIYFSLVFDAGYPSDVKTAIETLVQTRKDCMAFVDNGDNYTTATALTSRENTHTFNNYYMALYESYSKVYDPWTGRDIWVSPIFHMASVVPRTDNVAELWYAPAGFNRGTLGKIKELRFSPLQGDRDQFYLKQINPIVKFDVGYTVFGQLTTQRRPSAMQDVNIARLVLYVKRALEQFCKFYVFEMNDAATWGAVSIEVNRFLKEIQNRRGLYNYSVSVAASDYELKSKQFHVDVTLNPTRVAERINLNFFIK
jgi:hypothetical protein